MGKAILGMAMVAFGLSASVYAQDAVKVCPNAFKVIAEDDKTRVLHFTQRKGESCPMHSHPYIVAYIIKAGRVKFVNEDGTRQKPPAKIPQAGEAVQRPAQTHSHDVAEEDAEAITIEVKGR